MELCIKHIVSLICNYGLYMGLNGVTCLTSTVKFLSVAPLLVLSAPVLVLHCVFVLMSVLCAVTCMWIEFLGVFHVAQLLATPPSSRRCTSGGLALDTPRMAEPT